MGNSNIVRTGAHFGASHQRFFSGKTISSFMPMLSTPMLIIFVLCSTVTIIAMLRVLTNIIEHETDLHDLRNRVKELQYQRELRNAQVQGKIGVTQEIGEVEILDDIDNAQIAATKVEEAIDDSTEVAQAA
jgi:uncharacterized membrane protein (DUF106 family)